MNYSIILDYIASNVIVYISHILIYFLWYNLFFLTFGEQTIILYLPHGIIVLGFLFFGIKITLGLLLSQISFYIISLNYNFNLPFSDYLIISLFQLICMPLTLFILNRLGITVGDRSHKLDKTNILHVLIIALLSTTILGIFLISSTLFLVHQINLLTFFLGSFLGSIVLIVSIKLLVNTPHMLKNVLKFFKSEGQVVVSKMV